MAAIADFLNEETLLDLAHPADFLDGAAAAEHGAVTILRFDDEKLCGRVTDTEVYEAEFHLNGGDLAWSCDCGEADAKLCRHLVATALATWPEEAPRED